MCSVGAVITEVNQGLADGGPSGNGIKLGGDSLFFKRKKRMQYDFEVCVSWRQVEAVIGEINQNGYSLVAVTCDATGWVVFFGRCLDA